MVALNIFSGIFTMLLVLIPMAATKAGFLDASTKMSWMKAESIQYKLMAAGKKIRNGRP